MEFYGTGGGGGNKETVQVGSGSETTDASSGFKNYGSASYFFNKELYPLVRPFFNRAEHRDLSDAEAVTELICKFFDGVHGAAPRNESDTSHLEEFKATLLGSSPRIQYLFTRTYILTEKSGFDIFTSLVEKPELGPVNSFHNKNDFLRYLHTFIGPTVDSVDAGCFNRNESIFEIIGNRLFIDSRTKDFIEYVLDNTHTTTNETASEHIARAVRAGLEELFPETLEGEVFPTNIDKIAEKIGPVATVTDVQIVLNKLTAHVGQDDNITLNSTMSPKAANKLLEEFIETNKEGLADFTMLSFSETPIKMLPRAVRLLHLTSLLDASNAQFKLPYWIGNLHSLEKLRISCTKTRFILHSIRALRNLKRSFSI